VKCVHPGGPYRDLMDACLVREKPPRWRRSRRVDEKLLHCLWFDQRLKPGPLHTVDGREVCVLSPGAWNLEGGPDFRKAKIVIAGELFCGDVELHVFSSEWHDHGHHSDARYDSIILHVALWHDSPGESVRLKSGALAPQLVLGNFLEKPIGVLADIIDGDGYPSTGAGSVGDCHAVIAKLRGASKEKVVELVESAGFERFEAKAARFRDRWASSGVREEAFYQCLLEALGNRANRVPFFELSQAVPLKEARRLIARPSGSCGVEDLEREYLREAGLLEPDHGALNDSETARYVRAGIAGGGSANGQRVSSWAFAGARPLGSPFRRIAAAAHIVRDFICRDGLDRVVGTVESIRAECDPGPREMGAALARLREFVRPTVECYWDRRCMFGPRRLGMPVSLVGAQKAATLVVDVLLPAALGVAVNEKRGALAAAVRGLYGSHGPLVENHVTRFMRSRLFGSPSAGWPGRGARVQQGLQKVFEDFCHGGIRGCKACGFAEELGRV
jgi:hypothetical protein